MVYKGYGVVSRKKRDNFLYFEVNYGFMDLTSCAYRNILKKMKLSTNELGALRKNLTVGKICAGPFVKQEKMCPVTTAVSIKLKVKFKDKEMARKSVLKTGISNNSLKKFYLLFDVPARFSNRFFQQQLNKFHEMIDELIKQQK